MKRHFTIKDIQTELKISQKALIDVFSDEFLPELSSELSKIENANLDIFWQLLDSLEGGVKLFPDPLVVLDFLSKVGPPETFTIDRIKLFKHFFLQFHDIQVEQFEIPNEIFEYDSDAIKIAISILSNLEDETSISEMNDFLISIVQKSVIKFTEIVPFYLENLINMIEGPRAPIILQFLINFIDAIEGRIDSSKHGYLIFKYPKKMRNVRILMGEEAIDLYIHPEKTSLYSIRNVISAIKNIPLDSFHFDVDELNPKIKSIKMIEAESSQMDPSSFDSFPSQLLSNNEDFVQKAFQGLGINEVSSFFLKILHRMKIPNYERKVSFFVEPLADPRSNPAHYQFLTEFILFHLIGCQNREPEFLKLQKNLEKKYKKFSPIVNILFKNLVSKKYLISYQVSSIEILRFFVRHIDLNVDQFFDLFHQLFAYPKCQSIIYFLAEFLEKNDFCLDIRDKRFLTNLVLQINQRNYKAVKIVIQCLNGMNFFSNFLRDIINNPKQYNNISQFISKISRISLKKYPAIATTIINLSLDALISKPCQIVCDLLYEVFKVKNFDAFPIIQEFFFVATENNDLPLKKSIYRFIQQIREADDLKIQVLLSILSQEFHIGTYDPESFEPPVRYFNGLSNSGNTCYINCILQQLNSIDLFYDMLVSDQIDNLRPDIEYLKGLFSMLRFNNESISFDTSQYCDIYQEFHPEFDVHQQQDAEEYLRQLFEFIPNDCLKIFQGKIKNITVNNTGKTESSDEDFVTIPISLKNDNELDTSLLRYLDKCPIYDGDKIVAYKQTEFIKLPQVLIFHLHRFEFLGEFQQKINSFLSFPLELNMDNFDFRDKKENPEKFGNYHLKGVVIHSGDVIGGHYMSIIKCNFKNTIEKADEDHWLLFNDGIVTGINETDIFEMGYGVEKSTQNAYLLFYEKDN